MRKACVNSWRTAGGRPSSATVPRPKVAERLTFRAEKRPWRRGARAAALMRPVPLQRAIEESVDVEVWKPDHSRVVPRHRRGQPALHFGECGREASGANHQPLVGHVSAPETSRSGGARVEGSVSLHEPSPSHVSGSSRFYMRLLRSPFDRRNLHARVPVVSWRLVSQPPRAPPAHTDPSPRHWRPSWRGSKLAALSIASAGGFGPC
jgi:hypothetical protein